MLRYLLYIIGFSFLACTSNGSQSPSEPIVRESFIKLIAFSETIPIESGYFDEVMLLKGGEIKSWLAEHDLNVTTYYELLESVQENIAIYAKQKEVDLATSNANKLIFQDLMSKDKNSENIGNNEPLKCYEIFEEEVTKAAIEVTVDFEKGSDAAAKSYLGNWIRANNNYENCLETNYSL